jgi:hypothetical protein
MSNTFTTVTSVALGGSFPLPSGLAVQRDDSTGFFAGPSGTVRSITPNLAVDIVEDPAEHLQWYKNATKRHQLAVSSILIRSYSPISLGENGWSRQGIAHIALLQATSNRWLRFSLTDFNESPRYSPEVLALIVNGSKLRKE